MKKAEFESLLSKLVDERLSAEEFGRLEQCLLRSKKAREQYFQFIATHDALDSELQSIVPGSVGAAPIVPIDEIVRRQHRRNLNVALGVAAAVVLVSIFTMRAWLLDESVEPALTYRVAPSSSYTVADRKQGDQVYQLEKGARVSIEQGSMELSFRNGVRSVVNGPAQFTLVEEDKLELSEGVAWFQVPAQAVGFTVRTESMEVVDLGTEFGVIAGEGVLDEVHVLKGSVTGRAIGSGEVASTLYAGQARMVNRAGRLEEIDLQPNAFLDQLPDTLPYLHWSFDKKMGDPFMAMGNDPISNDLAHGVYPSSNGEGVVSVTGYFGDAISPIKEAGLATDWYGISGNAPRSASFWMKMPSQYPGLLTLFGWGAQKNGSDPTCRAFYTFSNFGYFGLSLGGYWVKSQTRIDDSEWHHVVIVYTGKSLSNGDPEVRFYLDGKAEDFEVMKRRNVQRRPDGTVIVDTAGKHNGGAPFSIFRHNYNAWPNADQTGLSIDELFIFKGALSAQEVDSLYHYNTNLLQAY
ncbi:LamG-like jellyroll fold domain-containing protein [Rubritalea tangerina]|uniref:LamG-like jellyroll fold domain-containing protein n=1 Tax=Rubritalea tangerina TaxID=430798 RepID=A0ABW4ZBV5_9BACT